MSRNFRSSFIDLLCCRYSKRNLFGVNESLRNRRTIDRNNNNHQSSYYKTDCVLRASITHRFTPMVTNIGLTKSTSSSRITNELSPMDISNNERKLSTENTSPRHITVELSETYGRRKQSDQSPVESDSSLDQKPAEVLRT
jgi:hypothetical protein